MNIINHIRYKKKHFNKSYNQPYKLHNNLLELNRNIRNIAYKLDYHHIKDKDRQK